MKQQETAGLWVALTILGLVAVLTYRSIDATAETLRWSEHAHQIVRQLDAVTAAYARAAAARRAYVVAGDASQLADLPALDARLADDVATMRPLLETDPSQLRRLDALAKLFDQRLAALQDSVAQRRREGPVNETVAGLDLVTRIRALREEIETEVNRQLAERDSGTALGVTRTKVAGVIGTVVSFAILLFAFRRLRHEVGRRRQSERFLDSIVANIPHMIFVKDAEKLCFVRLNRAGEDLLGAKESDMLGKTDFDFFGRDQAEFFRALDRETLANARVIDIPEEPLKTPRGERWLHTKKVPIVGHDGTAQYLLGISEDITDRRQAARVLRDAKSAAEAAHQELETFSYSVAHDLRAPLRAIDGFSLALQEDYGSTLDGEALAHLNRIRGSAQQMGQLIDGLLGLSRVTRGGLTREQVDLTRIARQSVLLVQEAHPRTGVAVNVQEGLTADGDPRLVKVVMDNLLANAWKFTSKREDARIEVGRHSDDTPSVIFVRDNGAGFDQAHAHHLFGAFQRLHRATEFEGSGIGLATVQRIVRRHGGRIWAEGRVGVGATFYFTLSSTARAED